MKLRTCPARARILAACLTALGAVSWTEATTGSPPPLVTDRPDQTESAEIVPRGFYQLEAGYTHLELDLGGEKLAVDSVPEMLLRLGLSDDIELRLGFEGYRWGENDDGLGDTGIGAKFRLTRESGKRPAMAVLAGVSLPTGGVGFTSERTDPSFRILLSNTLTERLSIGYNVGAAWATVKQDDEELTTLSFAEWTVALGIGATERLAFFIELFGATSLSASGGPENAFDGGVTYLVCDNFQLDAAVGVGLSDAAVDWFGLVGISYRWPR